MPPISYSMTRACTFKSQLPCTLSRLFIHSFIQIPPSNLITAQYQKKNRLNFNEGYRTIFPDVSVKAMPVWHGKNDTLGDYESTAFFIRHDPTGQEFLFFGDVSPDSLCESSSEPQTISVWRAAAPKIPSKLSTIFIECSWPAGRPDEQLYGHLSPEHLVDELAALAAEVTDARAAASTPSTTTTAKSSHSSSTASRVAATSDEPKRKKRRRSEPLAGLRIYVIHCKDDLERKFSRPICHVIRDQVEELVRAKGLGAEVLSAEQGMTISMSPRSSFFPFKSVALIRVPRSYLVLRFTSFTDGLYSWFRCTAFVYNNM
jgi:hypothetical protein